MSVKDIKEATKKIDENKQAIALKLVKRAVFMENTLNKLEKQIKEEGAIINNVNGNGFEVKMEHPAQKSYTALIGKYNALIKTLLDMIPEEGKDEGDALMQFLNKS